MQGSLMTTQQPASRAAGPRRAQCCRVAHAVVSSVPLVPSVSTGGHSKRSVAASAAVFSNAQSSAPASVVTSKERRQYVMEDAERLIRTDLGRIFETGDINEARYSKDVVFEDPLIKIQGLEQYKLYVQLLRSVFNVDFDVHSTAIIAENEVESRWSMGMEFWLLPWKPYFVFTGRSIYEVDPDTGIVLKHTDVWDALQRNAFLSMEGVQYVLQQLVQVQLTPSIQTPKYTVLQRFRSYEIRRYEPFLVAETPMSAGAGPASGVGFTELANYIFGGNQQQLKMEMTTPVFTTITPTHQGSTMQFVMESRYTDVSSLPAPSASGITTHSEQPAFVAVSRFSGWPLDFEVVRYERDLRDALLRDGFTPVAGYKLARYNEPTVPPMLRRNEVLINLANYSWPPAPTTAA